MKHPAIFGKSFNDSAIPVVQQMFDELEKGAESIHVYENFKPYLEKRVRIPENVSFFRNHDGLASAGADCLISVGGDGTILNAVTLIRHLSLPILGINLGRLGFLSNVPKEAVAESVRSLLNSEYTIKNRTLLALDTESNLFEDLNFALNELTVHKKDSSSMVTIHVHADDEYLNSYWADGLIVATPTGSTAYSLSCGGPILAPDSQNLVITPIAPHNLNVRPIVLNNDVNLRLTVEGRSQEFLVSLDSRSETIDAKSELMIRRANFGVKLIELSDQSFFRTIRQKLLWGIDRRN